MKNHDPGGKRLLPLPIWVKGSAVFGGDNHQYRYQLKRVWDSTLPTLMFLMMNPSTADPNYDDPSVAKCGRYARDWGYGTLLVGNSFAYRATHKQQLTTIADPVGPDNTKHLLTMATTADCIVFAYGRPDPSVRSLGVACADAVRAAHPQKSHILKLCKDGTPSHPLYLKGNLKPIHWI